MSTYLISFPSEAMVIPDGEFQTVVDDSHAVVREAKAAGVWVFGGGIDGSVPPVRVAGDGTVTEGTHPGHTVPDGGYVVLDVPSRESALEWAARFAAACRCAQEVRQFGEDAES